MICDLPHDADDVVVVGGADAGADADVVETSARRFIH